jgi:hypothetical protein
MIRHLASLTLGGLSLLLLAASISAADLGARIDPLPPVQK